MKKLALLLLLLGLQNAFSAQRGFFVGGNLGIAVGPENVVIPIGDFNHNANGTISGQPSDTYMFDTRGALSYILTLGYNFNHYLGIEAYFTQLGREGFLSFAGGITKDAGLDGNLNSWAWGMNAIGYLPLTKYCADIFLKVGLASMHSEVTIKDPNGAIFVIPGDYTVNDNDYALYVGAGLQRQILDNLDLKFEIERLSRFNNDRIGNVSYFQYGVGVIYKINYC